VPHRCSARCRRVMPSYQTTRFAMEFGIHEIRGWRIHGRYFSATTPNDFRAKTPNSASRSKRSRHRPRVVSKADPFHLNAGSRSNAWAPSRERALCAESRPSFPYRLATTTGSATGHWSESEGATPDLNHKQDPFTGHLFVFRGRRRDLIEEL